MRTTRAQALLLGFAATGLVACGGSLSNSGGTGGAAASTGGAGPGIVRVTSPEGRLLGTINLPVLGKEPKKQICSTNVAFGDVDGRTLYIAGCDAVYKVRLRVPGILQGPTESRQ